jgi:hypothetical protein
MVLSLPKDAPVYIIGDIYGEYDTLIKIVQHWLSMYNQHAGNGEKSTSSVDGCHAHKQPPHLLFLGSVASRRGSMVSIVNTFPSKPVNLTCFVFSFSLTTDVQ